jgi:hypothetical protein
MAYIFPVEERLPRRYCPCSERRETCLMLSGKPEENRKEDADIFSILVCFTLAVG